MKKPAFLQRKILKKIFFVLFFVFFLNFIMPFSSIAQVNLDTSNNFDDGSSKSNGVKIITVSPPGIFTLPESQTNITNVCTLGEALNITLDVAGHNKIEFDEPIVDMCDDETIKNLDQYFQMDKTGEVSVDSNEFPYLKNKSALITMRNLPFEEEPNIEVDGILATDNDIENKSWNESLKTLTFKAKHFTTYKAVESIPSQKYAIEGDKNIPQGGEESNLIIIIICVVLFLVVVILFFKFYKKN